MREITYREAVREAMREEMIRDESVFQIGEDIGKQFGGVFKVTTGLGEEFGDTRMLNTPIVEAGIVGAAVGAALVGMRPIAEIMYMDFTTLAMDVVINVMSKIRFMTGGGVKMPIVLRTQQGGRGFSGATHSQSLEAIFMHIPGLIVALPSTPYDAKGLLKSAIREENPVIFIEHKGLYPMKGQVPDEEYLVPLGKAEIKRAGSDITVVAISRSVGRALDAAKELEKEGISLEIIDPKTIKPLDEKAIIDSVEKTGRLIIVHEACKTGGFGAEVAAIVAEKAFDYLDAPIKRLAALDVPIPCGEVFENFVFPTVDDIVEASKALIGK